MGCLVVKLRSKFEIETSKPYFYLVFFDKKQQYLWNESQRHSFFSDPFLIFWTEGYPPLRNVADTVLVFSQYISHTLGFQFQSSFCIYITESPGCVSHQKLHIINSHNIKL